MEEQVVVTKASGQAWFYALKYAAKNPGELLLL